MVGVLLGLYCPFNIFLQLLEQQSKRLSEQDKIISHLTSRLSPGSSPTSLEEVEYLALARLPKVQGQEQEAPGASFQGGQEVPGASFQEAQQVSGSSFQEVGDSDSAIQLDCSYSSDSDSVTIRQSASQRSSETARMVRHRCMKQKTTIIINPSD